jgi:hypothetical protein
VQQEQMKRTQTNKAELIFDGKALVRIQLFDNADLEAEDILAINKAKTELIGEAIHGVLFIPDTYSNMSAEARKVSATPEINRNSFAKAIVIRTTHQRIIVNFFIKFNRPPAPTAVFNNEEDALKWLGKMQRATHSVH